MRRDLVSALVKFVLVANLVLSLSIHHALGNAAYVVEGPSLLIAHHGSDASRSECHSKGCERHQKAPDCCMSGKCFVGTLPQSAQVLVAAPSECVAVSTLSPIPWHSAGPDRPPKGGLFH